VLDHFFDQDIESLRGALGDRGEIRVVPYELLRDEALAIFPAEVETGLEAFARTDWEPLRQRYAERLARFLEEEYARAPFDAFVSPSDTFFYVRAAREACQRLGVPFFVAQKETTISEHTMRVHSQRLRELAPPVAHRMTVCSERHREFWLRAGADPSRVIVTGQPRFDVYAAAAASSGPALEYGEPSQPSVLFLSYLVDAYHPSEGAGEPPWAKLHRQTEAALWELARKGWRVLVKPHPQQPFKQERKRISAELGSLVGKQVFLIYPGEDARRLIAGSDVVAGFQTTALFEALVAGKPVVYTGWDRQAEELAGELIPFHEWDDVLDVARTPDEFVPLVEAARGQTRDPEHARRIAEAQLGPVDGGASERTLAQISTLVTEFEQAAAGNPELLERRRRLAAGRAPLDVRRRLRQRARRLRRDVGAMLGR
jgi:hypothetical protein